MGLFFAYPSPVFVPGCSLGRSSYLLGSNGLLAGLVELFDGLCVVTKIFLATNENNWKALAEVENFGDPLKIGTCQQSPFVQATMVSALPSPERCRASLVSQQQNK